MMEPDQPDLCYCQVHVLLQEHMQRCAGGNAHMLGHSWSMSCLHRWQTWNERQLATAERSQTSLIIRLMHGECATCS